MPGFKSSHTNMVYLPQQLEDLTLRLCIPSKLAPITPQAKVRLAHSGELWDLSIICALGPAAYCALSTKSPLPPLQIGKPVVESSAMDQVLHAPSVCYKLGFTQVTLSWSPPTRAELRGAPLDGCVGFGVLQPFLMHCSDTHYTYLLVMEESCKSLERPLMKCYKEHLQCHQVGHRFTVLL